ncbi:SDR family oxidoreductase [Catenuloplanes indicus JCM 9534]
MVTGGTRGIGAAIARAQAGVPGRALVLGYRGDHARARAIVAELDRPDSPVRAVACDVAVPEQVGRLFAAADELGELTGLVNSAAVLERQCGFDEISADRWARILGVNVIGLATCCTHALDRMRRGGVIVNLSSRAAVLGAPGEYVDYAASKAAVDTITRGLGLEAAARGIRVVGIRPGVIDTEIHASGGDPDRAKRVGPTLPLGRAGTPEDIARAVTWLLSPAADYITATTIDVSGGR